MVFFTSFLFDDKIETAKKIQNNEPNFNIIREEKLIMVGISLKHAYIINKIICLFLQRMRQKTKF